MTMNLDPSSALADKFKGKRQVLESAVLGKVQGIDPYSALRALQKLNVADKYEQMQQAMAGQQNAPSIAQQTMAQAAQTPQQPMPAPQGMPPQGQAPQQGAGLAGMPLPESAVSMAGGGIVAFAEGGDLPTDVPAGSYDPYNIDLEEGIDQGTQTPKSLQHLARMGDYANLIAGMRAEKPMTADEMAASEANSFPALQKQFGSTEYYKQAAQQIADLGTSQEKNLDQQKGLAALQAAAAMVQGDNAVRGLAGGAAAFGQAYGAAANAAAKEKQALAQMKLNLANAQRAEDLGLYKIQADNIAKANEDKRAAQKFQLDALRYGAQAEYYQSKAAKGPAGAQPKLENTYAQDLYALSQDPNNKQLQDKVKADKTALETYKTTYMSDEATRLKMQKEADDFLKARNAFVAAEQRRSGSGYMELKDDASRQAWLDATVAKYNNANSDVYNSLASYIPDTTSQVPKAGTAAPVSGVANPSEAAHPLDSLFY